MLNRRLYRTLLKIGRQFDRQPASKAFVFSDRVRFDFHNELYVRGERHGDDGTDDAGNDVGYVYPKGEVAESQLQAIVDELCAPGILYLPNKSLTSVVRHSFRQPIGEDSAIVRTNLGFLAIRYLFECLNLSKELTHEIEPVKLPQMGIDTIAVRGAELSLPHSSEQCDSLNPNTHLEVMPALCDGVLLVSHPLWLTWPFTNSLILLTSYSEEHAVGLILNKLYHVKFKDKLSKRERLRFRGTSGISSRHGQGQSSQQHGVGNLQAFFDCACYYGGSDSGLGPPAGPAFNFCILHTRPELAHVSQRLPLLGPRPLEGAVGHSEGDSEGRENLLEQLGPATTANNGTEGSEETHLYISHNFTAIGSAINEGLVSKDDIKIVHGCCHWTDKELEAHVAAHQLIPVRAHQGQSQSHNMTVSHPESVTPSPITINSSQTGYSSNLIAAIAMCNHDSYMKPMQYQSEFNGIDSEDNCASSGSSGSGCSGSSSGEEEEEERGKGAREGGGTSYAQMMHMGDLVSWGHGYHSWSKVLSFMPGEYKHFARIRQISALPDAPDYLERLSWLSCLSAAAAAEALSSSRAHALMMGGMQVVRFDEDGGGLDDDEEDSQDDDDALEVATDILIDAAAIVDSYFDDSEFDDGDDSDDDDRNM